MLHTGLYLWAFQPRYGVKRKNYFLCGLAFGFLRDGNQASVNCFFFFKQIQKLSILDRPKAFRVLLLSFETGEFTMITYKRKMSLVKNRVKRYYNSGDKMETTIIEIVWFHGTIWPIFKNWRRFLGNVWREIERDMKIIIKFFYWKPCTENEVEKRTHTSTVCPNVQNLLWKLYIYS